MPDKQGSVGFQLFTSLLRLGGQRTAPCVTAPASAAAFPPTVQVPRRTPRLLISVPKLIIRRHHSSCDIWPSSALLSPHCCSLSVRATLPHWVSFDRRPQNCAHRCRPLMKAWSGPAESHIFSRKDSSAPRQQRKHWEADLCVAAIRQAPTKKRVLGRFSAVFHESKGWKRRLELARRDGCKSCQQPRFLKIGQQCFFRLSDFTADGHGNISGAFPSASRRSPHNQKASRKRS
ncbi:MAG: hypothetical protein QOF48_358 [Verrucomicrobiota bacterium]